MSDKLPRVLVAGIGPLPPERPEKLYAPGLRAWGIARELARAGHPTRLVCAAFGERPARLWRRDLVPGAPDVFPEGEPLALPEAPSAPQEPDAGLDAEAQAMGAVLAAEAGQWGAEAVVSSTDLMNCAVAASGLETPAWMDYFGDPMAERQMLALRVGSDGGLDAQWALVAPALARADVVSGCSLDQCSALLGQMAAVGRLGRWSAGEHLARLIVPWHDAEVELAVSGGATPSAGQEPLLRSRARAGAFWVVQTGGFNTWLDVETLFGALEIAMRADPRVHFAATGGAIAGHYEGAYAWLERQASASPHRERYHLLGWRPLADVGRLLAEAGVAINLDLSCAEGIWGTRNRLLDWLGAGVPVISTPGCELAIELAGHGFLRQVPFMDAKMAALAILAVAGDPDSARTRARQGQAWLRKHRTAAICLRPLLDWAKAPKPAPDLQAWRSGEGDPPAIWRRARQASESWAMLRQAEQKAVWMGQKLARMEGSRWVRLALCLRGRDGLEPPDGK